MCVYVDFTSSAIERRRVCASSMLRIRLQSHMDNCVSTKLSCTGYFLMNERNPFIMFRSCRFFCSFPFLFLLPEPSNNAAPEAAFNDSRLAFERSLSVFNATTTVLARQSSGTRSEKWNKKKNSTVVHSPSSIRIFSYHHQCHRLRSRQMRMRWDFVMNI